MLIGGVAQFGRPRPGDRSDTRRRNSSDVLSPTLRTVINSCGRERCRNSTVLLGDSLTWPQSTRSSHSKSWPFTSTAQNFAIDRINRHTCTIFANPDGVALGSSIHLC